MTDGLDTVLASAVGVAISPIPVIAIALMLGTPRARSNGITFSVGWVTGLLVVCVLVLLLAQGAAGADTGTDTVIAWAKVTLGLLFFVLAGRQWQSRPRAGTQAALPSWMAALDTFTAPRAFGLGAALSGLNPKNLALTAAAAATIAQAALSMSETVLATAVFVLLASLTVAGPVVLYLVAGQRAARLLAELKAFLAAHNSAIMMAVLLVLGATLVGQGLSGV